jgi:hypothetical protein
MKTSRIHLPFHALSYFVSHMARRHHSPWRCRSSTTASPSLPSPPFYTWLTYGPTTTTTCHPIIWHPDCLVRRAGGNNRGHSKTVWWVLGSCRGGAPCTRMYPENAAAPQNVHCRFAGGGCRHLGRRQRGLLARWRGGRGRTNDLRSEDALS